ncbi:MAG: DUF2314 domain-containing protein, partial [Verrucomicrobiota bacterium]
VILVPTVILLLMGVLFLLKGGLSLGWIAAGVLMLLWIGWELSRLILDIRDKAKVGSSPTSTDSIKIDDDKSITALVFFLEEARTGTEENIRDCLKNALGVKMEPNDIGSEHFVVQYAPPSGSDSHIDSFMLRLPEGLFSLFLSSRPYIANPKEFADKSIRDKRLRRAVEEHQAWLSIDWMNDDGKPELKERARAYATIGRIMAALAGPDCLAIYCPELQCCNEFDPSLLEDLKTGNPLAIFDEPTFEPVVEVADNDPRMEAAVAEAVSRWGEFVLAFEQASEEEKGRFLIKAEFSEGMLSEFMWVRVIEIAAGKIKGILTNDPHELLDVYRGAEVEIDLDRLNDWIFPDPDRGTIGGFTLDLLNEGLD